MRKARSVTPSELRHHIREMMVATIGCNPQKIPRRIKPVNAKQILKPPEKNSEAKRMGVIKHYNEDCSKRMKQGSDGKSWVDEWSRGRRLQLFGIINKQFL
jgi:hypothetical protein